MACGSAPPWRDPLSLSSPERSLGPFLSLHPEQVFGRADLGWGLTFTTCCVTWCKFLELSQTWSLSLKWGKSLGTLKELFLI